MALITQIKQKPSVYNFGTGILLIISSESELYAIATPLLGFEDDNYHGGSIIMTLYDYLPKFN